MIQYKNQGLWGEMDMMHRQRFMGALRGEKTDRIPVFDFLSSKKLFLYTNGSCSESYLASDIMQATIVLGLDAAFIPYGGFAGYSLDLPKNISGRILQENQYMDEWGTVFQKNESSWPGDAPIAHPIQTREDFNQWIVPDAYSTGRLDGVLEAMEMNRDYGAAILGGLNGPFTVALMAMGLQNMSYAIADDPELIADVMHAANEFLIPAAEIMIKAGVDGIFVADDLGHKTNCFFHPDVMRQYVLPEIERLAKHIKKCSSYALFHSCGNINALFSDVVDMGFDAIHPIQKTAGMDLGEIKQKYGDKVCLIGNVDSTFILPNGSVEDVRNATLDCMRTGGAGGRFVLASDSDLRDDMPLENMLCMIETAINFSYE